MYFFQLFDRFIVFLSMRFAFFKCFQELGTDTGNLFNEEIFVVQIINGDDVKH